MKRITVSVLLCLIMTGLVAGGGLDFHLGAGYHSSYFGEVDDVGSLETIAGKATAMPLGIGGYAGIGFGLIGKTLNLGIEVAPSWDFNLSGYKISNFALQGRAYLKVKLPLPFSVAVFGGYAINMAGSTSDPGSLLGAPVFGARLTVFFIYAEYALTPKPDFSGIMKHEIGLGFAFFK